MNKKIISTILLASLPFSLYSEPNSGKVKALYSSLDPLSVSQLLAFYELYPSTQEGLLAKKSALDLLNRLTQGQLKGQIQNYLYKNDQLFIKFLNQLIALINRDSTISSTQFESFDLNEIKPLTDILSNRKLKGSRAISEEEVICLNPEEVDLARALLLSQLGSSKDSLNQIQFYETTIDLMSLQIMAKLQPNASAEEKIRAINQFIFEEMYFRFPPHSLYAKDIDVYTFLPSVLDKHLGVCLGVTTLYLCLSQRLNLPLEIITPPGHIYIRYQFPDKKKREINIETTARGVNIPTETYLSVGTSNLTKRNIKEVIGLTHVNQASVFLHRKKYAEAISSYEKAKPYLQNDPLLLELLAYSYILNNDDDKGIELLKQIVNQFPDSYDRQNMPEDFLAGKVDKTGIEAVFASVDPTRESIEAKRKDLEKVLSKYPFFRAGLFHTAVSWLQLNREKEALEYLTLYHELDSNNPVVEYYLSVLYGGQMNFPEAWQHLKNSERLLQDKGHLPESIISLRRSLMSCFPE